MFSCHASVLHAQLKICAGDVIAQVLPRFVAAAQKGSEQLLLPPAESKQCECKVSNLQQSNHHALLAAENTRGFAENSNQRKEATSAQTLS